MIFTGSELVRKRNFYTQNLNFSSACAFSVDNATGEYRFGISGNSGVVELVLKSGKIYKDDLFIQAYQQFKPLTIECQYTSTGLNILKNNAPLLFGAEKTSGDYNYVFFQREHTGMGANFNFNVFGSNSPVYTIDNIGYLLTTGQTQVTGNFKNNGSYEIKIFESISQANQNLAFSGITGTISDLNTGKFIYTGKQSDFNVFNFTQPTRLTFNTNFGTVNSLFTIVDARTFDKFVFLNNINDYNFNTGNEINRILTYSNYSGGFIVNNFDTNLIFKLEYISGGGDFTIDDFADSAQYFTTGYGNFFKSGLFTGRATIPTGNSTLTGNYIVNISQFGWATGAATGFFSGIGTGMASGIGYTGLAVGSFTGFVTGFIYPNSGSLQINSTLTGFGIDGLSLDYTGYVNATGYVSITGLQYGDYFYIGVENTPLVKGLQFTNETGLVYYLSGASEHKVNSFYSGEFIYLYSLFSGTIGNGNFVRSGNCNNGFVWPYSEFLTGGENIGSTGLVVYPIGQPYTGYISTEITGSGDYSQLLSGNAAGIFQYTRTFTGSWDLLTGLNSSSLFSLKSQGTYTDSIISGIGVFQPNSSVNFQINHSESAFNVDGVRLVISGADVLNPISTVISQ